MIRLVILLLSNEYIIQQQYRVSDLRYVPSVPTRLDPKYLSIISPIPSHIPPHGDGVDAVSNQWARYLLNYLYAVSDEDYDDDDGVGPPSLPPSLQPFVAAAAAKAKPKASLFHNYKQYDSTE